ncbi:SnoaL-like domain-containing protein [Gracilimonas mengyeensis]|uniref:SnoaL-like domain-containing protein n=1 Tax=Gracilimonas mengyeensis TaxID=1302730 RepID=A0A521DRL1_9BACT|nr:SnoaL-like domain-containing protein [Gracilimonas mengyeensis]SMO74383.1 SnoaL-like domain-containing protein [Gracilimonas mengyeensis]
MQSLSENIHRLNDLFSRGKVLEAFDTFYADEVVMQENEDEPTIGKAANREREQEFLANVTELRKAEPLKVAVGVHCTMVEWHFDYTHKEWGVRNYRQVSVQEWKDGKIVKEKFYYAN